MQYLQSYLCINPTCSSHKLDPKMNHHYIALIDSVKYIAKLIGPISEGSGIVGSLKTILNSKESGLKFRDLTELFDVPIYPKHEDVQLKKNFLRHLQRGILMTLI